MALNHKNGMKVIDRTIYKETKSKGWFCESKWFGRYANNGELKFSAINKNGTFICYETFKYMYNIK